RAQDIVNCITVLKILCKDIGNIRRSKKRVYVTGYDRVSKSSSLEIHLDTNSVLYCNYKVTIEFFTSLLSKFNPVDFVNNRITTHEANEIFISALSDKNNRLI